MRSLPSWNVLVTVLALLDWQDAVIDMLQRLCTPARDYIRDEGHLGVFKAVVQRHRWHPFSYGMPQRVDSKRLKRIGATKKERSSGCCNRTRTLVMTAWDNPKNRSLMAVCEAICAEFASKVWWPEGDHWHVVASVHRADAFCSERVKFVRAFSSRYFEFGLHERWIVVVAFRDRLNDQGSMRGFEDAISPHPNAEDRRDKVPSCASLHGIRRARALLAASCIACVG